MRYTTKPGKSDPSRLVVFDTLNHECVACGIGCLDGGMYSYFNEGGEYATGGEDLGIYYNANILDEFNGDIGAAWNPFLEEMCSAMNALEKMWREYGAAKILSPEESDLKDVPPFDVSALPQKYKENQHIYDYLRNDACLSYATRCADKVDPTHKERVIARTKAQNALLQTAMSKDTTDKHNNPSLLEAWKDPLFQPSDDDLIWSAEFDRASNLWKRRNPIHEIWDVKFFKRETLRYLGNEALEKARRLMKNC